MAEAEKVNQDREEALQMIRAEQQTIYDQMDEYRQMEVRYRVSHPAGAKIAKVALAELEQETSPKMAEL
jgi:hypothetical protein